VAIVRLGGTKIAKTPLAAKQTAAMVVYPNTMRHCSSILVLLFGAALN
jgi:hypothetical protein